MQCHINNTTVCRCMQRSVGLKSFAIYVLTKLAFQFATNGLLYIDMKYINQWSYVELFKNMPKMEGLTSIDLRYGDLTHDETQSMFELIAKRCTSLTLFKFAHCQQDVFQGNEY